MPAEHSSEFENLVRSWAADPERDGELVHARTLPSRAAILADLDPPLPGALAGRLAEQGIEKVYRHQARGIASVRRGDHTVLVSGTASGKSLAYQIPIAEAILDDHKTAALLLFPTKALAQDQLRSFERVRLPGLVAATYDGDTATEDRRWVRRHANVILTNPDMLHYAVLPNHARWADFFLRLRYVVVDEMHVLRGVFGSHVAHVLRRLRRVAAHYGASPTFVFASATIGNPGELAARLSGLDVAVIDGDDSPEGAKSVALWNPPLADDPNRKRRSALSETTDLFVDLVRAERHTIVFARSRKATELIHRWAADRLGPPLQRRIAPYRGGYLPADRRRIEARLFSGELLGVTATNALELGIDVGSLDTALVCTFPGTLASFWQQAGRAGRRADQSLVILVGGEDALDQYFMAHPDELFTRPPEAAVINPDNPLVVEAHTACAAAELPLEPGDRRYLGDDMEEAATRLTAAGDLRIRSGRLYWARRERPVGRIDLRTSGGPRYDIVDVEAAELLGTVEEGRAFRDAHPGAVYLHQGATYVVEDLDLRNHRVAVMRTSVDYYTQPKEEKLLEILETKEERPLGGLVQGLGTVRVESHVVAYQRRKIGSGELLDQSWLDLPAVSFDTEAVWFTVPGEASAFYRRAGISSDDVPGTLHAVEHAAIAMLPLFAICDRWDIGGLSTEFHPQTGTGTFFIYEGVPGGAGISPIAFETGARHLRATLEAVRGCPCEAGCPSCVQSPKCGNFNEPLSKPGAVAFLDLALGDPHRIGGKGDLGDGAG